MVLLKEGQIITAAYYVDLLRQLLGKMKESSSTILTRFKHTQTTTVFFIKKKKKTQVDCWHITDNNTAAVGNFDELYIQAMCMTFNTSM